MKANPTPKKMGAFLLPFFIFLFVAPISFAFLTEQWSGYQDNSGNIGYETLEGQYDDDVGTYCSISAGMNAQVLTGDFGMFIYDSTSIKLYDSSCVNTQELAMGSTLVSQPSLINESAVAFILSDDITYIYDLDSMTQIYNYSNNANCTFYTGITCDEDYCYYVCDFNITTSSVYRFNTTDAEENNITCGSIDTFGSPALSDDFTSAVYGSLAFGCDADNDNKDGICVVRTDTLALDTVFSSDGVIDDLDEDYDYIQTRNTKPSVMIADIDGGYNELIVTYTWCDDVGGDTYTAYLRTYEPDGTLTSLDESWTLRAGAGGSCGGDSQSSGTSNPLYQGYGVGDNICVLYSGYDIGTEIRCYDSDGTLLETYDYGGESTYYRGTSAIAEAWISSGARNEIISQRGILSFGGGQLYNFTAGRTYMSYDDLDGDDSFEVIFTGGSTTVIYTSESYSNAQANLSNVEIDTGNPVCRNDIVTFSATEDTDYTNDYNDNERLVIRRANGTYQYGNYSTTTPSVQLNATLSSETIVIYIQDTQNDNDFSSSVSYTVTTSENENICNPSGTDGTSTDDATTTESDIASDLEEGLEEAGVNLGNAGKIIIWVVMMLSLSMGLYFKKVENIFAHLILQGGMVVIGAYAGFLSIGVTFFFGFIVVGLLIISLFNRSAVGGG